MVDENVIISVLQRKKLNVIFDLVQLMGDTLTGVNSLHAQEVVVVDNRQGSAFAATLHQLMVENLVLDHLFTLKSAIQIHAQSMGSGLRLDLGTNVLSLVVAESLIADELAQTQPQITVEMTVKVPTLNEMNVTKTIVQ